jgi:hypothetical protein
VTTPLWVPLLVAALGLIATVSGTLMGAWVTAVRADRREDLRWERERAKEREAWAREDAQRTFEQRRTCYIEFEECLRSTALCIHNAGYSLGPALEFNWQFPLYERLLRLRVFASPEVAEAADSAYNALYRWGNGPVTIDSPAYHDREESYDAAQAEYLV